MKKTVTLYVDAELYEFVKKEHGSPSKFFEEAVKELLNNKPKTSSRKCTSCWYRQKYREDNQLNLEKIKIARDVLDEILKNSKDAKTSVNSGFSFTRKDIDEILLQMEMADLSEDHIKDTKNMLLNFAQAVSFQVNNNNLSRYINELKQKYAPETFRKYVIDIRWLLKHIGHPAAEQIKLPKVPKRRGIVIKREDIQYLVRRTDSLKFKSERLRLKAAILVAATSGLRSEELYKLTMEDIDIEERIIYLKAEITKDSEDRVTFFNEEAQEALIDYLDNIEIKNRLFAQSTVVKDFRKLNTSLRMKHMRKFFSQEWDRLGGPTSIKKMLMGHAISNDVDILHYDFQDVGDLKKVYDSVGIKIFD